jgi:hypothetical protein
MNGGSGSHANRFETKTGREYGEKTHMRNDSRDGQERVGLNSRASKERRLPSKDTTENISRTPQYGPKFVDLEGLKDVKKNGVPVNARGTRISRQIVDPEALELGKEKYKAEEDSIIVWRVLSRDEVQQYANLTHIIRGLFPISIHSSTNRL